MRKHVGWLLLIPIIAALAPWAMDRRTPALIGIPFFYWYQLLMVPLSSAFVLLVMTLDGSCRADRRERGAGR